MTPHTFNRLHALRMENDSAGFAMAELAPRFQTMKDRHENGTAPRVVVAYQLFQTPPALAAQMADALDLSPGARVLEPSAGLGRLLDALTPHQPGEVVAVESAKQCAAELYQQDRQGVKILQRDFLQVSPAELGLFDAVIMNPPFHMRADVRHITHAVQFLRPGGRLVALCLDGYKRAETLKPLASTWRPIPAGTFGKEGTSVQTVLVIIDKPAFPARNPQPAAGP